MTFQVGHPQCNTGRTHFKKGHVSWLKGTEGIVIPNKGSFRKGHNAGIKHENYNGGLCFDKNKNRWLIWCRDNTYQAYARALMEAYLRRMIRSGEIVHHINHDSTDDRIDNLKI